LNYSQIYFYHVLIYDPFFLDFISVFVLSYNWKKITSEITIQTKIKSTKKINKKSSKNIVRCLFFVNEYSYRNPSGELIKTISTFFSLSKGTFFVMGSEEDASLIFYFYQKSNMDYYNEIAMNIYANLMKDCTMKKTKTKTIFLKQKNKLIKRNHGACAYHKKLHKKCPLDCENRIKKNMELFFPHSF
jgi:hypothetical protein